MNAVLKSLRRHPGANLAIVITLALAMASTVVVSTLIQSFLHAPLPHFDDRGVTLISEYDRDLGPRSRSRVSWDTALDVRREIKSFSRIGVATNAAFTLYGDDATEVIYAPQVSAEFLDMLDISVALGSPINATNALIEGQPAMLLTHSLWQRRFGGRRDVIGASVQLDQTTAYVVGVLHPDFEFPLLGNGQQAWVAMEPESVPLSDRSSRRHFVFGELAPGISTQTAGLEAAQLGESLSLQYPKTNQNRSLAVIPLREALVGPFQVQLWILLATSILVLLVAGLNSGALLLSQALRRRREFAVRLALGTNPARLLRLFWAENMALTFIAALLSVALASWLGPLILEMLPSQTGVNTFSPPAISLVSWSVALCAAIGAALIFGLMPWSIARTLSIETTLRSGGRSVSGGLAGRFSSGLVTGQIAVALSLAIGAVLLLSSSQKLSEVDYGFPVDELYQFRIGTRGEIRNDNAARLRFFDNVRRDIAQLPGVASASFATFSFPNPPLSYRPFIQEGDDLDLVDSPKQAQQDSVSPEFFQTHDIKLIHGRGLQETDLADHPRVTVVNASLAERFWPNGNPVGKRVKLNAAPDDWFTIVGVMPDQLSSGLNPRVIDQFLVPFSQVTQPNCAVFVRFSGAQPPAFSTLQRVVWNFDPDVSIFFESGVGEFHRASQWQQRFSMILIGAFATLAITLCAGGLYAVLAFMVASRTRELGVRAALGASYRDIQTHVLRDAAKMIIPGLVIGILLSVATSRALGSLLFDVSTLSLTIYLGTGLGLSAVCIAAAWFPARRATQIDPAIALRSE